MSENGTGLLFSTRSSAHWGQSMGSGKCIGTQSATPANYTEYSSHISQCVSNLNHFHNKCQNKAAVVLDLLNSSHQQTPVVDVCSTI